MVCRSHVMCKTAAMFGIWAMVTPVVMMLQTADTNVRSRPLLNEQQQSRGDFLKATLSTFAAALSASSPNAGFAADDASGVDVYFGVGCFWHIQHEFVEAERKLLGRADSALTSRTGYAGGKKADKENRVCYHNFQSVADYGKLGFSEVVGMNIPESSIGDFAKEYFSLFTAKGERVDPGDRGGEYRSLLGLPGGMNHAMYPQVEAAASARGMKLLAGNGNEPDTFGTRSVYVMDSTRFPFYQAEVYHQFHDDFQSPPYGKAYNSLQGMAFKDGRIQDTGCPDRFPLV